MIIKNNLSSNAIFIWMRAYVTKESLMGRTSWKNNRIRMFSGSISDAAALGCGFESQSDSFL